MYLIIHWNFSDKHLSEKEAERDCIKLILLRINFMLITRFG